MIERRRRPSLAELWAQTSSAGPYRAAAAETEPATTEPATTKPATTKPATTKPAATRNAAGDHGVAGGSLAESSDDVLLVILRGNPGAGKSTLAAALRHAEPSMALVEEQSLQRARLAHADISTGNGIADLVDLTVRFFLDRGQSVVLEGLLRTDDFRSTISGFLLDYRGNVHLYYLDVSFAESLRRHPGRQLRRSSDANLPTKRHVPGDLLAIPEEIVIPEGLTLDTTLARITAGLSESRSLPSRHG